MWFIEKFDLIWWFFWGNVNLIYWFRLLLEVVWKWGLRVNIVWSYEDFISVRGILCWKKLFFF